MSSALIVQFANIYCQFNHFGTELYNNTWKWKLDPYRVMFPSEVPISVVIGNGNSGLVQADYLLNEDSSGFFSRRVSKGIDGKTIWSFVRKKNEEIYLQYVMDSSWNQIKLLIDNTQSAGTLAFEYLGQMMPGCLLKHSILTLHGVLIEYQGKGIIISAPSGTGKTTHARLWRDYKNALILNGDRAVIGKTEQGWTAYGTPWSGTSGEQINRHAPLHALVILERSEKNSVEKLEGLQAFAGMMPHVLYPAWDRELAESAIDGLNDMISNIPVYRFYCRPEKEAVEVLYQALYEG